MTCERSGFPVIGSGCSSFNTRIRPSEDPTMNDETPAKSSLKDKAIHEGREMLVIFLYLALFFCTFTVYRRLVLHEVGISYFHYGFALLKALVMAKVILLGQQVKFGRKYDDRPLFVSTCFKVVLFSFFYLAFEILEHVIGSLLHHQTAVSAFQEMISVGKAELLARTLVILFALCPFFAFTEVGRVLGEGRLYQLFFRTRNP